MATTGLRRVERGAGEPAVVLAEMAAAAPRGRHLVVGDSGHSIPRRRPAAVARAIMDVVGQVRAGR